MSKTESIAEILSGIEFSAAEYVTDKPSVLLRARRLYEQKTGKKSDSVIKEIDDEINILFNDRKLLSVDRVIMPDELKTGNWIGIIIDGELIYGIVQVSPKRLSVEYEGYRRIYKLDDLAPVVWTEYPQEEANEYGKNQAIRILTDLYYIKIGDNVRQV